MLRSCVTALCAVLSLAGPINGRAAGRALSGAQPAPTARGESAFDPAAPAALEVKRAPTGHLLVRPVVNGREAGWFIFDTGAGICVVSTGTEGELGLEAAGQVDAVGAAHAGAKGLYTAKTVALGPVTLRDHPVMSTDLAFLKPFLGDDIAGVIGYGVLSRCVVEIDVGGADRAPRVALHDPKGYSLDQPAGGGGPVEWGELRLTNRIPAVKARFEDREGLFHIDTGANGFVTFNQPAVEKWKLLDGRDTADAKLGGVGGFTAARKGPVAWFEVGGLRQENITATFATEAKGNYGNAALAGSIGADALRPFTLVLDYGQKRVAFITRGH